MKVFINNRNLLTWPKAMAEILAAQGHEVVFIDNASTYPPLLGFYGSCPYRVARAHNGGPATPWSVIGKQLEPYVVTDPDLDLSGVPPDWPEVLLEGLELSGVKCGFSIYDQDLPRASAPRNLDDPPTQAAHDSVWDQPITGPRHGFFGYPVDTHFAVYDPTIAVHRIGGCRAAPPYTVRHLPWHVVLQHDPSDPAIQIELDDEYRDYLESATNGSSMRNLPYVQRMMGDYDLMKGKAK